MKLFEQPYSFRRTLMLLELGLLVYVTQETMKYIILATNAGVAAAGIVAVATVIQAPFVALLGYTFKLYSTDRYTNASDNSAPKSSSNFADTSVGGPRGL